MGLFNIFNALFNLLIMLVAMTMNGYVIISIVLGTGFGKTLHFYLTDQSKHKSK